MAPGASWCQGQAQFGLSSPSFRPLPAPMEEPSPAGVGPVYFQKQPGLFSFPGKKVISNPLSLLTPRFIGIGYLWIEIPQNKSTGWKSSLSIYLLLKMTFSFTQQCDVFVTQHVTLHCTVLFHWRD